MRPDDSHDMFTMLAWRRHNMSVSSFIGVRAHLEITSMGYRYGCDKRMDF
jgi:hypothetical protein